MNKIARLILFSALTVGMFSGLSAQAYDLEINPAYQPQFVNNEAYNFNGDMYTFVSHVVGGWDSQRVTYRGVQSLLGFSKKHIITTFGVVSRYGGPEMQFFKPGEVSFIVESDAGQHRFSFSKAKTFLIGGGNLSLCLCELLRDVVRGTHATYAKPLNLFLVSDAVYDDDSTWPFSRSAPSTSPKFTLAQLVDQPGMTNSVLKNYISRRVIGENDRFCPGQNYFNFPNVDKSQIRFQIYRDHQLIGTVGSGTTVKVNLIVTKSADLERVIRAFGADLAYPQEFP